MFRYSIQRVIPLTALFAWGAAAAPPARADFREAVAKSLPATVAVRWRSEKSRPAAATSSTSGAVQQGLEFLTREQEVNEAAAAYQPMGLGYANSPAEPELSLSSGAIVSADGLIVTPKASDSKGSYEVTLNGGRTLPAKVVAIDRRTNLELIKVDGQDLPYVELSETPPAIGQSVVATVSTDVHRRAAVAGMVAAIGTIPGFSINVLHLDMEIGPMSGGSPLVDRDGQLVGILIAKTPDSGQDIAKSYAVTARMLKTLLQSREGAEIKPGYLGMQVEAQQQQVKVQQVVDDSPAAQAEVQKGDVVAELNGKPVRAPEELVALVREMQAGATVNLTLRRDDDTVRVEAVLAPLPAPPKPSQQQPTATSNLLFGQQGQAYRITGDQLLIVRPDGKLEVVDPRTGQPPRQIGAVGQPQPPATPPPPVVPPAPKTYQPTVPKTVYPPATPTPYQPLTVTPYQPALMVPSIQVQRSGLEKTLQKLQQEVTALSKEIEALRKELSERDKQE